MERAEEGQQGGQYEQGQGDAVDAEVEADVEGGDPVEVGLGLHGAGSVVVEAGASTSAAASTAPVTVTPWRSTACPGPRAASPGGAGSSAATAPASGSSRTPARSACMTVSLREIKSVAPGSGGDEDHGQHQEPGAER